MIPNKSRRYLRPIIFMAAAVLVFQTMAWSQAYSGKARLKGIVTDEQGQPLADVRIKLYHVKSDSGFETKTNAKGEWTGGMLRGGAWYLDFSKDGYEPKKVATDLTEGLPKAVTMDTKMKKVEGLFISKELLDELAKGNDLFNSGKYDEALAAYNDLLKKNPEAYVINYSIGNVYFSKEDYDQAIPHYQAVLDKNPAFSQALVALGNCYANKKDLAKAMEIYNKLDIAKIDDPIVLYNIGTNYFNQSVHDQALKYYSRALELNPNSPDCLYQMGLTQLTLGQYKEAMATFENYLKQDPDSERAASVKNFIEFLKTKV